MAGQFVFDWDQLENFLITRDRPVGNKVTNPISHAKVEYHMCKHKCTVWGCRGCGRIPNAEKLANIQAKIFKIWAKYTATFTCNEIVFYFPN